jgi:hypothetical protein
MYLSILPMLSTHILVRYILHNGQNTFQSTLLLMFKGSATEVTQGVKDMLRAKAALKLHRCYISPIPQSMQTANSCAITWGSLGSHPMDKVAVLNNGKAAWPVTECTIHDAIATSGSQLINRCCMELVIPSDVTLCTGCIHKQ